LILTLFIIPAMYAMMSREKEQIPDYSEGHAE